MVLTRATAELVELVLFDSAKIQREQAERRQQRARRQARQAAAHLEARPAGDGARAAADEPEDHEAHLRAQPPAIRTEDLEPLYDEDDVAAAVALFRPLEYDQPREVAPGIRATFRDAGHILGSAIIVLDVEEGDGTGPPAGLLR